MKKLIAAVLVVAPVLLSAEGKPLFIALEQRGSPLPTAVSDSGTIVGSFDGRGGFYWMPTTGVIANGGRFAVDVSADGRTIVGIARDDRGVNNAAIWLRAAEWRVLGGLAGSAGCVTDLSNGIGTNRDGTVVVGWAWQTCGTIHAFRWEESTGMVDLGTTVPGASSKAEGVSGDGRVVVGSEENTGFEVGVRWVQGRQERIPGEQGIVGTAYGANHDGSIVVGRTCRPVSDDQSAWIWTAAEGTRCLPVPEAFVGPYLGYANATSDDGRVVGGAQYVAAQASEAVIWIDGAEFYLKDYLRSHGAPNAFEGWINTGQITDVSADGRILVGWGLFLTGYRGYLVILDGAE